MRWIFVKNAVKFTVNFCEICGEMGRTQIYIFFNYRNHRISYKNSPKKLDLGYFTCNLVASMSLLSYQQNSQWQLVSAKMSNSTRSASHGTVIKEFNTIVYTLELKRKPEFYVYSLVVPSAILTGNFQWLFLASMLWKYKKNSCCIPLTMLFFTKGGGDIVFFQLCLWIQLA